MNQQAAVTQEKPKHPVRAQSTGIEATEQKKAEKPFDPTDVSFFIQNMRVSDQEAFGAEPYKWNTPKVTPAHWGLVWRHTRNIVNERVALASRGIFLVEKDGAIFTQPFSGADGLFKDESFDKDTGRIHSKHREKDPETGTWAPEMVLYVRPIGAQVAAMKRLVERVIEKTERKPEKRNAEQRDELLETARSLTSSGSPGINVTIDSDDGAEVGYETL